MKIVWLIQLGTPDAPTRSATKRYLDEFLMDPRMIELPAFFRALLVKGVITPFRSGKSAKAYQAVWMPEGSPLAVYSDRFAQKLQSELGSDFHVFLSMRYGEPSIEKTWNEIRKLNANELSVIPLFPQYSSATTASVYDEIADVMKTEVSVPALQFFPPFYKRKEFIEAFAERGRQIKVDQFDHVLFSFHGLPEKLVRRANEHCLVESDCCKREGASVHFCYRAQCFQTAWGIQKALGLEAGKTSIAFQSRLAGEKWLDPYTDQEILKMPARGIKRLAIFCPSFVADCLETLEEIGIRAREDFIAAGGKELRLVPSLNDENDWVSGFASWLKT